MVLQVLDARDPEGCRSTSLEESILSSPDKRLVMVSDVKNEALTAL